MDTLLSSPKALDGKFGDGQTESHGEYSAKEGAGRAAQARPGTNMQVGVKIPIIPSILSPWEGWKAKVRQGIGK